MTLWDDSPALDLSLKANKHPGRPVSPVDKEKTAEVNQSQKQVSDSNLDELIQRSQQGQLEAFEGLYNLYKNKVYGLAYSLTRNQQTAEDLTQDIFIKIFSAIQEVNQPDYFPAWVYRLSLNTCYSYLRRQRTLDEKLSLLTPAEESQNGRDFDSQPGDLARAIQEALCYLPEKLRMVFVLHEVEGLTHEEIAGLLNCQAGTSKSQLFKARLKLRKILRKKNLLGGKSHEMP
ncbi:MAG TPA: RNA polymerase subunit sigma-24 [Acidobacteria bacterium]|nr:RNA polymerase subunit sigma-24 [Acidobacteriota bacterium]